MQLDGEELYSMFRSICAGYNKTSLYLAKYIYDYLIANNFSLPLNVKADLTI
jgi:hypothetical protein